MANIARRTFILIFLLKAALAQQIINNAQIGTLHVSGTATLSSSTVLNGTISGTHGQNVGLADSPTFSSLAVSTSSADGFVSISTGAPFGSAYLKITGQGGSQWRVASDPSGNFKILDNTHSTTPLAIDASGNWTGTHIQNLGSADSPSFSSAAVNTSSSDGFISISTGAPFGSAYLKITGQGGSQWRVASDPSGNFKILDNTHSTTPLAIDASGNWTGTHVQNHGTADSPTFSSAAVNTSSSDGFIAISTGAPFGSAYLKITGQGGSQWRVVSDPSGNFKIFDNTHSTTPLTIGSSGSWSGSHIQNLGSSDNPTFGAITVSSCTGCGSSSFTAGSGISISGSTISNTGVLSISAGTGIAVSGTTVSLAGFGSPYATGSKYFGNTSGASGTLATYSNTIDIYDAAGSYIGRIPII